MIKLTKMPYGEVRVLTANQGSMMRPGVAFKNRPDLWFNQVLGQSMNFDSYVMYLNCSSPFRFKPGSEYIVPTEADFRKFAAIR